MELCIKGDQQGLLYGDSFNNCLKDLKQMGIDLKPYFSSSIPFLKVDEENKKFNEYHSDPKYCIIASNENNLFNALNLED